MLKITKCAIMLKFTVQAAEARWNTPRARSAPPRRPPQGADAICFRTWRHVCSQIISFAAGPILLAERLNMQNYGTCEIHAHQVP